MTHIQELRDVIHHLHNAKATHPESVPVKLRHTKAKPFGMESLGKSSS